MNYRSLLALTALAFGAAHATEGTEPTPTATIDFNTQQLVGYTSSHTVTLTDSDGNLLATLNADGSWEIEAGADLSLAAVIVISDGETDPLELQLTSSVDHTGQPKVSAVNAAGKSISIALPAALNRQANAERKAPATAPEEDAETEEDAAPAERAGKPELTGKARAAEQAGKSGKGR